MPHFVRPIASAQVGFMVQDEVGGLPVGPPLGDGGGGLPEEGGSREGAPGGRRPEPDKGSINSKVGMEYGLSHSTKAVGLVQGQIWHLEAFAIAGPGSR